jgi:hypothetical protein
VVVHDEDFKICIGLTKNGLDAVWEKVRQFVARNHKADLRTFHFLFLVLLNG